MQKNVLPETSVIIPCFNQGRYLAEAVNSVLNQSCVPAEIIVIDDGSTDETADVAASFGNKIEYVYQQNAGLGAARNAGIKKAKGDLIAFSDSDDYWSLDKLEKQVGFLHGAPNVDMVFGKCRQFISPELPDDKKRTLRGDGTILNAIFAGSMLARRAVFDKAGFFATHLQVGEFIDWFARAKAAGATHVTMDDVFVHRRMHGENMSLRMKAHQGDYLAILKASLDRQRKGA